MEPDDRFIHSSCEGKELNGVVIRALYLLKEWLTPEQLSREKLICVSRIEGEVEVVLVPSFPNCPGLIGLFAAKANHGFKSEFGFSISGAPGMKDDKGFCDNLTIIYPHIPSNDDIPILDYKV